MTTKRKPYSPHGRPPRCEADRQRRPFGPLHGPQAHPFIAETERIEAAIDRAPEQGRPDLRRTELAALSKRLGADFADVVRWALEERDGRRLAMAAAEERKKRRRKRWAA